MVGAIQNLRNKLESLGIESLGLAVPMLFAQWSNLNPTYNNENAPQHALSLQFPGVWNAPVHGMLSWHPGGCNFLYELNGVPLQVVAPGGVQLLTLHPQAYNRLEALLALRLGAVNGESVRPTPRYLALQLAAAPTNTDLRTARAGDLLTAGLVTFHDARGQIIDPVAVAAWFADLMTTYPALVPSPQTLTVTQDLIGVGGATTIANLAQGTLIHGVDLHGAPWQDPGAGVGLQQTLNGNTIHFSGVGAQVIPPGTTLGVEPGAPNIRIGWATSGVLGQAALAIPAFPGTNPVPNLNRDFLRLIAFDQSWHLLGNRTQNVVKGISGCDVVSSSEPSPTIRTGISFNPTLGAPLADGLAWTGTVNALLTSGGATPEDWAVSPAILPTSLPASGAVRWPASPAPAAPAGAWVPATVGLFRTALNTPQGLQAAWSNATPNSVDVVVTVAAGLLPSEAFVRFFPRRFLYPQTLFNGDRSYMRGDGVSALAPAAGALQVLLVDPLGLGQTPRPAMPILYLDLLVIPRPAAGAAQPRLLGGLELNITGAAAPPPVASPGGVLAATNVPAAADGLAVIPANHRGVSSAALKGLTAGPAPVLAIGAVTSLQTLIEFILQLGQDTNPYEAPRFPTMARNETLLARRTNANANGIWNAVITGGWLTPESVQEQPRSGCPGLTAAPELHAPGLEVDGGLAYDLGMAAHRRTKALVPRITDFGTAAWDPPNAGPTGTCVGAVLQSLAPYCDTPELGFTALTDAQITALPNNGWVNLTNQLEALFQDELNIPIAGWPAPLIDLIDSLRNVAVPANAQHEARIVQELIRETWLAQRGRRDAQWSLKRAIGSARELIYIETPHLGPTTYPDQTGAHTWDLLADLGARLQAVPSLKVVIALPEVLDYDSGYAAFAQQAYDARYQALFDPVNGLITRFPQQVVAFHPQGFPGRPMHLRTSLIVVDDVWALLGSSTLSRRGLTFDGGTDVVFSDLALQEGYSVAVRALRRASLAQLLGVPASAVVANPQTPSASWVRLGQTRTTFAVVQELLEQGGQGLIIPIRKNPTEVSGVLAADPAVADPDGRSFLGAAGATPTLTLFLTSFLAKV